MATQFDDTAADHKWSTAANWSAGKPDSADAVTVGAAVTSIIIDEAASCLSFSTSAASGITISGSGALSVYGSFTLIAADTWTNTGILSIYTNAANITTGGNSLSTAASMHIRGGCDAVLKDALNLGTKALYVYGAGSSLDSVDTSNNWQIDCGIFGDNGQAGAVTLTLGSSTINCTNVSFASATLTVTSNTAALNVSGPGTMYFGAKTWGGPITITLNDTYSTAYIRDANTFGNLTIVFNPETNYPVLFIRANQTISGTLTMTGNVGATHYNVRGMISAYSGDNQTNLTATTVSMTGAIDFQRINGVGGWDLSSANSGNCGGNSNIVFRTATTYYLAGGTTDIIQDYGNVWSLSDDGTADGTTVFPLPQDTIIINNNSWSDAGGNTLLFHADSRQGTVDASAMTESNTLGTPRTLFGNLIYTGAGLSVQVYAMKIDPILKNDTSETLDINITPAMTRTNDTIINVGLIGTVRLVSSISWSGGTWEYQKGNFNLNGNTLTIGKLSSAETYTRVLQDTAGGAKVVVDGVTGTIIDIATANLTVSNAPSFDIGTGGRTLTGNVTLAFGSKPLTFGALSFKKHAGNYSYIVTGVGNTFGAITQETPDATYQYNKVVWPNSATTNNCTSYNAAGTADYKINILSASAGSPAHLTDTDAGTNTFTNAIVADMHVTGGTWSIDSYGGGTGNEGWTIISSGGIRNPFNKPFYGALGGPF